MTLEKLKEKTEEFRSMISHDYDKDLNELCKWLSV